MATSAARAPCARTRPPPSRPLVWRQRLAWGVRAHRAPGLSLPRPGLLSVAALRVRARAGNTHPPSGLEHPGLRGRSASSHPHPHLLLSSSLSHSRLGFQEGPRLQRRETWSSLSLNGAERWTPSPEPLPCADYRGGLCGIMGFPNPWSARPPTDQHTNLGEGFKISISLVQVFH